MAIKNSVAKSVGKSENKQQDPSKLKLVENKEKSKSPKVNASKKLKTKKLEERIAPGMVGGGIVDPGMADGMDAPQDTSTPVQEANAETSITSDYIENEPVENTDSFQDESYNLNSFDGDGDGPTDPSEMNSDQPMNTSFDGSDMAPSGDYMVEGDSWREPDWVTAHADGSVQVMPPDGVSIENGIANFPPEIANDSLPLPENVTLQADGTVNVQMPEGTQYNDALGTLTLPVGDAQIQDVPAEFTPVENPDGSLTLTLPESGVEYNEDTHTLNLSNDVANDLAPSNMEIAADGSVNVTLPEGTQFNEDGSFTIPADQTHFMDNPPPEYVSDLSFADYQPDGSCNFEMPEGSTVADGFANFPHDVAIEELPIQEDFHLNSDGTANVDLPDNVTFNADANSLNFPAGEFSPDECPSGIQYFGNADGSWTVMMSDGMSYDSGSHSVVLNNYWVNEFTPEPVYVGIDGSVSVELPPGTEMGADGQFTIPADQVSFMDGSCPDYVHDAGFAEPVGDGSYVVSPPDGAIVTDNVIEFPNNLVATEVPLPHDMEIHADGSVEVPVPEGTQYNAEFRQLTFPSGTVQLDEIPEGVDAHLNPDGTITACLPQGIDYQADSGTVTMNNQWANEMAPAHVEITETGSVSVTMPAEVNFQPDGTIVVPAESADFIQNPDPSYCVNGPDWVTPNPDGSVTFEAPGDVLVNPEQGTMTMSPDVMNEHFDNHIPEGLVINLDGSIEMPAPEGATFNAEANALTVPAGQINPDEIPEGIHYQIDASGALTISFPPGMEFNSDTGTIHMDNHWANEIAPECVDIQANGQVQVELPPHTQYFEDGSFTVPAPYADFVDNPAPGYVVNGPEFVNASVDGTVQFNPPPELQNEIKIDSDQGQVTMSVDVMNEHFDGQIPDEVTFHQDGTVSVQLPEYTQYDADNGVVTFPAETAHMNMPPAELQPYFNEDGSLSVKLPEGIEYDPSTHEVKLDNYWTNELAPQNMEISESGQVQIQLPDSTHYSEGGCSIPPEHADFMENPQPEYVSNGPEWVDGNPDGSFTVHPPEGMVVDPEAGTVTMSMDTFRAEMDPPSDMTFNSDGTANIGVPEGTTYDAANGTLTFPADATHPHEIPPQIPYSMNADGSITIQIPEGIEYDAGTGTVHLNNAWLNELAPEPLQFNSDGSVSVHLPEDTQYFEGGAFVVSAESADFMDDGHHDEAPRYEGTYPYPEYQEQYNPQPEQQNYDQQNFEQPNDPSKAA